jgi:succinate-semialdehyde dehydrogenase / glutarate-semialdehyde dehydrogenase
MELEAGMIINGDRVAAVGGGVRKIINPADGSVVTTVPDGDSRDVAKASATAREGFEIWKRRPTTERAKVMHSAAALVKRDVKVLAEMITSEMGKPIRQARSEASNVAELIDFFAEEGLRVSGEVPNLDLSGELPLVLKEPVGVVGTITPFNYPISLLSWKLGPALITGCSVIAKPDEHAPSAALRLGELFLEAGLPKEVFQVVTGGAEVGRALVEDPAIDKIAFTGSVEAGRSVGAGAMATGKRVTLELGGQCPALVDPDADLDAAMAPLVQHTFNNSGQYCYRINRIYVDARIHDEFVERFTAAAAKLLVRPGIEEDSDVGSLCHPAILERSERHIADVEENGGKIVLGGRRLTDGAYKDGFFMPPTIAVNCKQSMLVMQEETFGPVVGIMAVDSLTQAVELANDSIYGLAAYVFTGDSGRGLQAARQLRVGSVWVNGVKKAYPQLPFGGYKSSGVGREKSRFGLDEYLELKAIYLQLPSI